MLAIVIELAQPIFVLGVGGASSCYKHTNRPDDEKEDAHCYHYNGDSSYGSVFLFDMD